MIRHGWLSSSRHCFIMLLVDDIDDVVATPRHAGWRELAVYTGYTYGGVGWLAECAERAVRAVGAEARKS